MRRFKKSLISLVVLVMAYILRGFFTLPPLLKRILIIQLQDGHIDSLDEGPQKKHTVRELKISMASISNTPQRVEIFVQPALFAKVNG